MFDIVNREGQIVEVAQSSVEAVNVVTHLNLRDREAAPFFCRPQVTATITYVEAPRGFFSRLLGR